MAITLTDRAVSKIKEFYQQDPGLSGKSLRVYIESGGCSGFEYKIEPDTEPPHPQDQIVESQGLKVYMDAKSILYMAGSELDYVTSLMNAGFKIKNPQSVAECSCGQSFTV